MSSYFIAQIAIAIFLSPALGWFSAKALKKEGIFGALALIASEAAVIVVFSTFGTLETLTLISSLLLFCVGFWKYRQEQKKLEKELSETNTKVDSMFLA